MSGLPWKISRPDTPYLKGVHIAGNYQDPVLKKSPLAAEIQRRKTTSQTFGGTYPRKDMEKLETEGWLIVPIPLSKRN